MQLTTAAHGQGSALACPRKPTGRPTCQGQALRWRPFAAPTPKHRVTVGPHTHSSLIAWIPTRTLVANSSPSGVQEAVPAAAAVPPQHTLTCDVAIVGGGLAGLALAAGLHYRGWNVQLFEAAPELRTGTSTMIGMGENIFACLEWLHPAVGPQLRARGSKFSTALMITKASAGEEGQTMRFPVAGRHTIRWSEVQNTLADLVPVEALHCGYRATGYTEDAKAGRVRVHFKDRPDVEARLVVAADGLKSALRAAMLPNDPGPRYMGQMCWNGLLWNPDSSVVRAHEAAETLMFVDTSENDKRTLSCTISDAGGGYTYVAVATRNPTPAYTPDPSTPAPSASTTTTPADAAQSDRQLAAQSDSQLVGSQSASSSLVGGGQGRPGSKARLIELLEDAGWDVPLKCVQALPESEIFERAVLDRVPLDELGATLSSPGGRLMLLGDAAHAMHPGPGQGEAFEDVHTLVRILEENQGGLVGWTLDTRDKGTLDRRDKGTLDTRDKVPDVPAAAAAAAATHTSSSQGAGDDRQAVEKVVGQYLAERLTRVCKIQRLCAEGCGVASIRDAARPAHVPVSGPLQQQRSMEFMQWVNQYPKAAAGDPDLVHWKP